METRRLEFAYYAQQESFAEEANAEGLGYVSEYPCGIEVEDDEAYALALEHGAEEVT